MSLRITEVDISDDSKRGRYISYVGEVYSTNGIPIIIVKYRSKCPVTFNFTYWVINKYKSRL